MGACGVHRECHDALRELCSRIAGACARDELVLDGAQGHAPLKAR